MVTKILGRKIARYATIAGIMALLLALAMQGSALAQEEAGSSTGGGDAPEAAEFESGAIAAGSVTEIVSSRSVYPALLLRTFINTPPVVS